MNIFGVTYHLTSTIVLPLYWKCKYFFHFCGKIFVMETFGHILKQLRIEKGLGQVALAKKIGVGKSIISLWENDVCEPTLSKLVVLARFFDVSIDYLAGLEY